jgi:DNA topoisomerase-1
VLEETCSTCGRPQMAVERGARFQLCVDPTCEPLDEAVAERFDGTWDCPDCSSPLTVDGTPAVALTCGACGLDHPLPHGRTTGACACGLPLFDTPAGIRCLDGTCRRDSRVAGDGAS